MIRKYIKKSILIEAIQYTGYNFDELLEFAGNDIYISDGDVYMHTLNGDIKMANKTGDYLIKDANHKFYFCEKQIFEETYKEVNKINN